MLLKTSVLAVVIVLSIVWQKLVTRTFEDRGAAVSVAFLSGMLYMLVVRIIEGLLQ